MLRVALFTALTFACSPATVMADVALVQRAVDQICPLEDMTGLDAQARLPGAWLLSETRRPATGMANVIDLTLDLGAKGVLEINRLQPGGGLRRFTVSLFARQGEKLAPVLQAAADGSCRLRAGRAIRTEADGWVWLDQLEDDLVTLRWSEILQMPWPEGRDPGGIRVALVDSGLAYNLPGIADRLARDATGHPLGYDFWDMDPWPYDGDTGRNPFAPIRHGTAVASVLLREAPSAQVIPLRYPRPDMSRMGDVVAHAADAGARILAMPLGSRSAADWTAFTEALARHDMLAIVSAGNNGQDIDATPLYPATLPLENMLVVTSSDGFGKLAEGSNWGGQSVDIMLPAERVPVTDFRGAAATASGSSYAVPRLAALAVRLLERDPNLDARSLRAALLARAKPSPFEEEGRLAAGWIADPLDD